jgi:hypothetical protein
MNLVGNAWLTYKVSLSESVKLQSIAEAKSLGSEIVDLNYVFLGVINVLKSLDAIGEDDELLIAALRVKNHEKSKQLDGFKTPVFDSQALNIIPDHLDQRSLKEFAEQILQTGAGGVTVQSSQSQRESENLTPQSVGGFHDVDGPSLGRLPKFMPQKNDALILIASYLMKDEKYIWDGAYNTKDPHLSTRRGNAQSLGRVFVTNFRLIFWSDDGDKPHIGVLYSDISSWKTNWMPMKSRGVIMYVSNRKILFVANSTAMEHASTQQGYTQ